jgi:hypothetical protein
MQGAGRIHVEKGSTASAILVFLDAAEQINIVR